MNFRICLTVFLLIFAFQVHASSIILYTKNATVWLPEQTINGKISDVKSNKIIWHLNNTSGYAKVNSNGSFSFTILLKSKENTIWVNDASSSVNLLSDTIHYTLGYKPLPEVLPFATIKNNGATLDVKTISNPYNSQLKFLWKAAGCAAPVLIHNANNKEATVEIPAINGRYYFTVTVFAGEDSAVYKTYVTRNEQQLHAFNITDEHAAWIDSAVLYEITPDVFVHNGKYTDITAKLTELKQLGINTIWLQPVYKTYYGNQGYDVTDYFALRADLGTEAELQQLITEAKKLKLRVLLDFVPNHTSIYHNYAQQVIKYGKKSHYYNFYQHTNDGVKYSSHYHIDSLGFVHYFWPELVNLNYNNPEVKRWIIEALKYWMQKFNLDGYRLDATWTLNARDTAFGKQLQTGLKSINPDILLLAEDKGALKHVYAQGYDAAYDWTADTNWISKWSWATKYNLKENPTIFNNDTVSKRSSLLNKSLFDNGDTEHLRLRFLENNDVPRFITAHGKQRTEMASALVFSLPGIPMLYNGQEIGYERKTNGKREIFKAGESIQSLDTNKLFTWYQQLIAIRLKYDVLRSTHMQQVAVQPETMYALNRWKNKKHIIVLLNLDEKPSVAKMNIHSFKKTFADTGRYVDLLTNDIFYAAGNDDVLIVPMKEYSTRLLLAGDD